MNKIFENTEIALQLKSDSEIKRAVFLFQLIKKEPLVKIGKVITNYAIKANLPIEKLIRSTVFNHFCGGITEKDCTATINKMYAKNVHAVLDYSVEGKETEEQFEITLQKVLSTLEFAKKNKAIPFVVFKPTGFGRIKLFQKKTEKRVLFSSEKEERERIVNRFDKVCKKAHALNIPVLIDAEESRMQDAADNLIEEMMFKYNKK